MILTIILFVIVAVTITLNAALFGLAFYLWKSRRRALRAVDSLNNAVYSLSVDKAYLIAERKPNLLWYDKKSDAVH